ETSFHVFEDGQPQKISHFASEDIPLELIVGIDISGSMTPSMPKLKNAVKEFLGSVPAQDQVTLLGFNDNIFTLSRKQTNPAERVKAVDRLAPWGSTALYDVILRGVEMLGRQAGRKALVIFTDGEDQGSHATIGDVERRLQASDVALYMIGQGRGITMDALKRIMERLAAPTGGRGRTANGALAGVACMLGGRLTADAQDQAPRFQTTVDVTSIDVTVVDDRGKPITTLVPGEFMIRIDGNLRRVVSAEWISLIKQGDAAPVVTAPEGFSTNEGSTAGRLIVIAVDEPNIRFGGALAISR